VLIFYKNVFSTEFSINPFEIEKNPPTSNFLHPSSIIQHPSSINNFDISIFSIIFVSINAKINFYVHANQPMG
jgi:hypothetical protein